MENEIEIRDPSELQIQSEIWRTLWADYKQARRCLYHVPNEATYDNGQQASSGVIPGIQDLHFVWQGKTWYIELKDNRGVISKAQKMIHALWKVQGYDTYVFYDAATCIAFLRAIIEGVSILSFAGDISPYSVADRYEQYLAEYQEERRRRRANKAKVVPGKKYYK